MSANTSWKYRLGLVLFFGTLPSFFAMTAVVPMASMAQSQETIEGIGPTIATSKVVTGFEFAEGPASDREGNLYFTDFPKNRIYRFSLDGELSVFAEQSGQANGLMVNGEGELVACQMDGRVVAYSLKDPKELAVDGIKVNSVCPGWVMTDMGHEVLPDYGDAARPKTVEEGVDTPVWLATLPDDGPTGGFFTDREPRDW